MPGVTVDRARELLAERRARDPVALFQPYIKQGQFVDAVLSREYPLACFFGANRCGKTALGAFVGARIARGLAGDKWPVPNVGCVMSLSFASSRDVSEKHYLRGDATISHAPFIPDREVKKWFEADRVLLLKNGSEIYFRSDEQGASKQQGLSTDWQHIDEACSKAVFDELSIRVPGGGRGLTQFVTATLLPPPGVPGGISWMHETLVRPWQAKDEVMRKRMFVVTAGTRDNPSIATEELARLEAKYAPGSWMNRIRVLGELVQGVTGARAYANFDPELNVAEPGELEWRDDLPLAWCWDFNVQPSVSVIGQRVAGRFQVLDEIWLESGSVADVCEAFRNKWRPHPAGVLVYGDASGNSRSQQTNRSYFQLIMAEMADWPGIRLRVPNTNPSQIDRMNAVNSVLRGPDAIRRLVIDGQCRELIADLLGVLVDPRSGGILKSSRVGDPYSQRTHISDALGYWVSYECPVAATTSPIIRAGQAAWSSNEVFNRIPNLAPFAKRRPRHQPFVIGPRHGMLVN